MKCWSRKETQLDATGVTFQCKSKTNKLCIAQLVLGELREGKSPFRSLVPVSAYFVRLILGRPVLNGQSELTIGADGCNNPRP